jgi:hypothetical protein
MLKCKEYDTKQDTLEGYRHPPMGKLQHLCSPCFDKVSESVAIWGEFVRSNSLILDTLKNNPQRNLKKMLTGVAQIRDIFNNLLTKKEFYMER